MSSSMLGPEGSSYLDAINTSNYDYSDHHSLSGAIKWTTAVLMSVVLLMVSARFIVRIGFKLPRNRLDLKRALGSDDYLILGAALATVSFSGFAFFGAQQGLGQHIWNILAKYPTDMEIYRIVLTSLLTKLLYGCYCSYTVAITLTKLSIIASYLRLFPGRTFRRALWTIGVCVVLLGITSLLVIILECDPPRASWDWTVPRSKCIDIQLFFYISSTINVTTDFALWFAPMRYFWKSNMPGRQKFELMLLYAVGLVGCLAGLFRLGQLKGLKSSDITYEGSLPLNCSMAEVSFGIICACVPPLRPALAPILHRLRTFGTTPKTVIITPATSPQTNDFRAYQQQRLSRVQEADNVEMDEFDQNFRQYLGASIPPMHVRTNPSQASTIGERGSATSERIFL